MDKNQLLDYYTNHYLSRREIMFKLPFNISIEEFWKELSRKRKSDATILPLFNHHGKPYWFVMTEKMIRASEMLCEEAMHREESDPYRMEMTSAMTWEMFFTSFVEGTDLDLDEALDYLSRDAEPTGVQEQLLWNNRQAHCAMVGGIYHPVDEEFVKHLAFLLTQDLDGTASDYRLTDQHLIAAMNGENYSVPAARDIPERMKELFDYLSQPQIHPLIKAAVSQAYLLTTRPFPEGNERLARLISALILYRSGYDYFKDYSISRKIAKENYRYYKCMKEILSPENDADLTYFIEYYLDLLARILADEKEESKKRAEEANHQQEIVLTNERQLSTSPLPRKNAPPPPVENIGDLLSGATPLDTSIQENSASESAPDLVPEADLKAVRMRIAAMSDSSSERTRQMGRNASKILEKGCTLFSVEEWAQYAEVDLETAKIDCYNLRKRHILVNRGTLAKALYSFNCVPYTRHQAPKSSAPNKIPSKFEKMLTDENSDASLKEYLVMLEHLPINNTRERKIVRALINVAHRGFHTFTTTIYAETNGISSASTDKDLRDAITMGLIYRTTEESSYKYHFGESPDGNNGLTLSWKQTEILNLLRANHIETFTVSQLAHMLGLQANSVDYHVKYMLGVGAIKRIQNSKPLTYRVMDMELDTNDQQPDKHTVSDVAFLQPAHAPLSECVSAYA